MRHDTGTRYRSIDAGSGGTPCEVVHIRAGGPLDPQAFLELAARLGPPVSFALTKYRPADFPREVTLIDSHGDGLMAAPRGFGEGWHQDSTYLERPPAFTVLHATDAPDAGGRTLFADTRPGLTAMSENEKAMLRTLRLEHAVRHTYRVVPADIGRSIGEISARLAAAHHEVVMRHPRGGETLRLSPLYTEPYLEAPVRPLSFAEPWERPGTTVGRAPNWGGG